jgi:hypothetical protein
MQRVAPNAVADCPAETSAGAHSCLHACNATQHYGAPVMLLCLSSRQRQSVFEESVEVAGEVAFEAAVCFASCLAFLEASFDVGDRGGV